MSVLRKQNDFCLADKLELIIEAERKIFSFGSHLNSTDCCAKVCPAIKYVFPSKNKCSLLPYK